MDAPHSRYANWWKYPVGVLAVLAPLAFVWKVDVGMAGGEYELNTWFIGYNGEYFRQHHAFPPTLQTSEQVGAAAPVFYGYVLFKVAGLLSLIGGAHLAVRILVVLCLAAVYLGVRHALRAFRATEALATTAACAVCWAVYPLTNLYNRFAFAEFVAASCLTCSCCLWMVFFLRPRRDTGWYAALGAGFLLAAAVGTHPITGLLSVPFLAVVYALHWAVPVPERPGVVRRHAALLAAAALAGLVLAPWLYAYAHLGSDLAFNRAVWRPGLGYFEGGDWTSVLLRLSPVPVDYQHLFPDSPPVGVAHLDTQINLPLLIVAVALAAGAARAVPAGRRRLAFALAPVSALGLAAFFVSVYPSGFAPDPAMQFPGFPLFLCKVQFAYRLVAVINLAVLLVAVAALAYRRAAGPHAARVGLAPLALGVVATLSVTGLMVKLVHGKASVAAHRLPLRNSDPAYQRWLVSHPFGPSRDYVTVAGEPEVADHPNSGLIRTKFEVGTGDDFGRTRPLAVAAERTGYVTTQALPFRWNQFRVDGHVVPPEQLRVFHELRPGELPTAGTARVAVPVPPGAHTVEYKFQPPRNWTRLNALAVWVFGCWFAALAVTPAARRALWRRPVVRAAEGEALKLPLARAA